MPMHAWSNPTNTIMIELRLPRISNYMQKMSIVPQTVFKITKSCNLIGGVHFGL